MPEAGTRVLPRPAAGRAAVLAALLADPDTAADLTGADLAAPAPAPVADRRILRAGTVRSVDVAQLAVVEQQDRARRQDELDVQLAAATERGRAAGVADTLREGSAAVLRAGAALERLTEQVCTTQDGAVRAVSDDVLALALQVAEWVLRRELAAEGGRELLARLEVGLTALLPSPTTRISVSHADHPLISEWAASRGRVGTTVVADHRLQVGDAVVVTDAGRAEVTVVAALRSAADALGLPAADAL